MRHTHKILVVDDEKDLCTLLTYNLAQAGLVCASAHTGDEALRRIRAESPDLVILDLMLPGLSGIEVAERIRADEATRNLPIIMLTAKAGEGDQIAGLELADDYVPKPFSMKVLLARIRAVLRRVHEESMGDQPVRMGAVELRPGSHEVLVDNLPIKLTITEFRLLRALLSEPGRVLTRQALMRSAMGPGVLVTERTIDVHITSIRRKLGAHAGLIKTVRSVGYRAALDADESIDTVSGTRP